MSQKEACFQQHRSPLCSLLSPSFHPTTTTTLSAPMKTASLAEGHPRLLRPNHRRGAIKHVAFVGLIVVAKF